MNIKKVIVNCLLLIFVASLNAQTFYRKGVKYRIYNKDKVEVTYITKSKKVLSIPSTVKYNGQIYTVERMGGASCLNLEHIDLPTTLKEIGKSAFHFDKNLKSIKIPEGVEVIGEDAFHDSGLEHIYLPTTLKEIKSYAFCDTKNLKSIKIPEGVEVIGKNAFSSSGLEQVELPKNITKIDSSAFCSTYHLKSIKIPEGVEQIEYEAFFNSGLKTVFFPSSLKRLGNRCFSHCKLKRLVGFHRGLYMNDCFNGCGLSNLQILEISAAPQGFEAHIEKEGVIYVLQSMSDFLKSKVEPEIIAWQKKGEFENTEKWKERVNDNTRKAKISELTAKYGEIYANIVKESYTDNLKLSVYDSDNESFLVTGLPDADILLSVKAAEAPDFKQNWDTIKKTISLNYVPTENGIALTSVTFSNDDRKYTYDSKTPIKYSVTDVEYNFKPLDFSNSNNKGNNLASLDNSGEKQIAQNGVNVERKKISVGTVSDVDRTIPSAAHPSNGNTFAVIIGNENYQKASKVEFANNDAAVFAQYCQKALGIPEKNVRFYTDATYATMLSAVDDIQSIAKAFNGDVNIVFYYAGHGIPNENGNDAFLLPIDTDGKKTEVCYSLARLYNELGGMNVKSVIVFMDACFSGAQRGDGMLMAARGVAIKAKPATPQGNMVVFSAASGDETAYPYKEKEHGLFTYYLLKKLQETKGDVTLGELRRYIVDNVTKESVVSNGKSQTPTVVPSDNIVSGWENMKLR